jgi:Family of unknown function (DUF6499)
MRTESIWESDATAERCAEYDFADFAQEFLRRNPAYVLDYVEMCNRIANGESDSDHEKEVLARRWGLRFPLRSFKAGERGSGALGREPCGKHDRARTRNCRHYRGPSAQSR